MHPRECWNMMKSWIVRCHYSFSSLKCHIIQSSQLRVHTALWPKQLSGNEGLLTNAERAPSGQEQNICKESRLKNNSCSTHNTRRRKKYALAKYRENKDSVICFFMPVWKSRQEHSTKWGCGGFMLGPQMTKHTPDSWICLWVNITVKRLWWSHRNHSVILKR